MSSKKVKWISIRPSERQAQQSMLRSISNIYEACVELITNTEDEYERMNRNSSKYSGECRIELKRGNVVNNTVLKIKDKGRGMSAETLKSVLMDHGDRIKSDGAKRGFNGRGLIDVSAIGDVTIKSINSGKYSEARIKHLSFQMAMIKENATPSSSDKKDVYKHGTTVEVVIPQNERINIPTVESFLKHIRQHHQLRHMLCKDLKDDYCGTLKLTLNNKGKDYPIEYTHPKAEKIYDQKIILKPKQGTEIPAYFTLYKTKEFLMESSSDDFSDYGIIVKGEKAIYENSFLDPKLKFDNLAKKYYGILKCKYIDDLAKEWEVNRRNKNKYSSDNPIPIADPERRAGLDRKHPFIKNHLFKEPIKILSSFLKEDRVGDEDKINDKDLKDDMDNKMDILADMIRDMPLNNGSKLKYGEWKVIPSSLKVERGKSETFRVYANKGEDIEVGEEVHLSMKEDRFKYIKSPKLKAKMHQAKYREEQVACEFEINGIENVENIEIPITTFNKSNGKERLRTSIKVSVYTNSNRKFENDIEYEFNKYNVKFEGSKKIRVFAKYPECVGTNDTNAVIEISNNQAIKAPTNCIFKIVPDTNYAVAEFNIKGTKKLDSSSVSISVPPYKASVIVDVVEKEDNKKGGDFDWDFVSYDLGTNARASWDPNDESKLLITTHNKLVQYYLGSKKPINGTYPNSKKPVWKMFLNDILGDMYAEKIIMMKSRHKPESYMIINDLKGQIEETMNEASRLIKIERNDCIQRLHDKDKIAPN